MSEIPETRVLAVASHVTSGYVGNTMATFCMQTLGCEVSAINTVNYSNHVAYKRFKGRKSSPEEIAELYAGLQNAGLDSFDVMLSGYCPSADVVKEVGKIARDAKLRANTKPGSFFWVLDPVMGDNGRLYVPEETVPVYKSLLYDADLILPNQTEAELLTDIKIVDRASMHAVFSKLHREYHLPHVLITSMRLPQTVANTPLPGQTSTSVSKLSIIGSTATSDRKPRLFRITVPALPIMFSGTGDMFAALLVARFRQAAQDDNLLETASWQSPDDVAGPNLPLARATEKVLASMNAVLEDTAAKYAAVAEAITTNEGATTAGGGASYFGSDVQNDERHLRLTQAAEVRVVRNTEALRNPPQLEKFKAHTLELE